MVPAERTDKPPTTSTFDLNETAMLLARAMPGPILSLRNLARDRAATRGANRRLGDGKIKAASCGRSVLVASTCLHIVFEQPATAPREVRGTVSTRKAIRNQGSRDAGHISRHCPTDRKDVRAMIAGASQRRTDWKCRPILSSEGSFRSGRRPRTELRKSGLRPAWSPRYQAIPCRAPCREFPFPKCRASHHPFDDRYAVSCTHGCLWGKNSRQLWSV